MHRVIVLACHEVEEIGDVYFNDLLIDVDANGFGINGWAGHIYLKKYLGAPGQTADPTLLAYDQNWTSAHSPTGHAYIYLQMRREQVAPAPWLEAFGNVSAVVTGKKVYDPRTGLTAYSENPALCIADYMNNAELGLNVPYGTASVRSGLAHDWLVAAANTCDEDVNGQARYALNGVIDTVQPPREILGRMLTAMAGKLVRVGGEWKMYAGEYIAPVRTFTEDDMAGPIKTTTLLSARDAFNAVKGVYVSPENNWQLSDFPALESGAYLVADSGVRRYRDIELPFETSSTRAQRLAKIELLRARQGISHVIALKMQG